MTTTDTDWTKHPFYSRDPLPGIEPALLNSLDIRRYVDKGCLLDKDSFDPERMKPASYEMRLLGQLYHWEEVNGRLQKRCRKVSDGDRVMLSKNSISYLWTEERLRLPEYIAARFNLRIRDVHKGILLGTGPLIDPGFGGRILIPLHNLTDNDYSLTGGEGIIWVEFTKVSKNEYWIPDGEDIERPADLVAFPSGKVIADPNGYLSKAAVLDAGGVESAFKGELKRAQSEARKAVSVSKDTSEKVDRVERHFRGWGLGGVFAGLVGVSALMLSAYQLSFVMRDEVNGQRDRIEKLEETVRGLVEAQSTGPVVSAALPGIGAEETASAPRGLIEVVEPPPEPERSPGSEVGQ